MIRSDNSFPDIKFQDLKRLWVVSILLVNLIFFSSCQKNSPSQLPAEKKRELANVLYNQQLYEQAIKEYKDYLAQYSLPETEQANISFQIANIYFDRLHDYENSLAYYLRIRYLYPESGLQTEVNKKVVECLERMKRSTDAQQVIEQTAALDESQKPTSRPGEIIARIGNRTITSGDLQYEISRLPVYKISTKRREASCRIF